VRNVLIWEPDPALRRELLRAVRGAGYCAEAADSFSDLEKRLGASSFDAAIYDVVGSEGLVRLKTLVEARRSIAVLATGASPSVEFAVDAMKCGARDFLRKPFPVRDLEAALGGVMSESSGALRGKVAETIVTEDPGMEKLLSRAVCAAASQATVQIVGESGTGKDLLAHFIHAASPRRSGPFVSVNCAALPQGLWESELFGHERGAFSGAEEARVGQVASAEGGTLLLDEVCDVPLALQPKLLRVIQEREIHPVGAAAARRVDLRILATTQKDLRGEVDAKRFREDLFYRLDVIVLQVPPLRERLADIRLLSRNFLKRFSNAAGVETPLLTDRSLAVLDRHEFRGNVRELENLMRRAAVLYPGREIDVRRLLQRRIHRGEASSVMGKSLNLRELERRAIFQSLVESEGNRTVASRSLGISVRTLRNKIRLYGLKPNSEAKAPPSIS
jgi:DNA-binding NtrC family response regulator